MKATKNFTSFESAVDAIIRVSHSLSSSIQMTTGISAEGFPSRSAFVAALAERLQQPIPRYDTAGAELPREQWDGPRTIGLGHYWGWDTLSGVSAQIHQAGLEFEATIGNNSPAITSSMALDAFAAGWTVAGIPTLDDIMKAQAWLPALFAAQNDSAAMQLARVMRASSPSALNYEDVEDDNLRVSMSVRAMRAFKLNDED